MTTESSYGARAAIDARGYRSPVTADGGNAVRVTLGLASGNLKDRTDYRKDKITGEPEYGAAL
ncbi:hypothetical protein [Embleya sp. NPDC059237]|uniref:hypothetical protein n=1 Tax=Embleya sp. NPDC059237 TaxID=3346784 RepID=UPI00367F2D83